MDPYGETWSCGAFLPLSHQGHTCVGFKWQFGRMTALPTLGGNNGFATAVNDHGQIAGWAENAIHDPTCIAPQVLQFEAVIWGPGNQMQQLPPFGSDPDSAATGHQRPQSGRRHIRNLPECRRQPERNPRVALAEWRPDRPRQPRRHGMEHSDGD
jgi:hypothetical protein